MGNDCCSTKNVSKDAFEGSKYKQQQQVDIVQSGSNPEETVTRKQAVNAYMKEISVSNQIEQDNLLKMQKILKLFKTKIPKERIPENSILKTIVNPNVEDIKALQLQYSEEHQYSDQNFPPEITSISKDIPHFPIANRVVWKRITNILESSSIKVFVGEIEPGDIFQGSLGDCYFLSALSSLAEHPKIISKLFDILEYNPSGFYAVWLNHDGKWKNVIVDDYFPCIGETPCFSKSNGPELWVMILEKAYSKLFGSYHSIQSGIAEQAITDLTGSPSDWIETGDEGKTWEFIFPKVEEEKVNPLINYILAAGSKSDEAGGTEVKDETGIISGHAYAVLDAKEINTDRGLERIIQLRNPWGSNEWQGDWSDKSDRWTPELKELCGYSDKEDGLFWMPLSDFCQKYSDLSCNYLCSQNSYSFVPVDFLNSTTNLAIVPLQASADDTKGYVQFHQKDSRNFKCCEGKYEVSQVRLMIFSGEPSAVGSFIGEISSCQRNGYIKVTLPQKGPYFVVVSVDWACNMTREIVISAYVDHEVFFEENNVQYPENEDFLDDCFLRIPPKKPGQEYVYKEESEAFRFSNSVFGYFFFAYVNQSTSTSFKENVTMTKLQDLKICSPYEDSLNWEVTIKPQSKVIVKYRIQPEGNGGYSYSFKFSNRFTFSTQNLVERILQSQSKKVRTIQGEEQPVIFYNYFYSEGLAFYYKNDSDKIFCEEIEFKLQNLESEDGLDLTKEILIEVEPHEGKLLKFKEIDENAKTSYSISYSCYYKE